MPDGVNNSGGVQPSFYVLDNLPPGFLSPDAIIDYFSSRLHDTDNQVHNLMAGQQQREAESEALGNLASTIDKYKGGIAQGADGQAARDDIAAALQKVKETCGNDPSISKDVASLAADFYNTAAYPGSTDTDSTINSDELTGFAKRVSDMQTSLNQGGEIDMLKLQSLMSGRQQTLQLASNMISNFGDTTKSIIQNIHGRSMTPQQSALEGLYATGIWLLDQKRPADAVSVFRTMMVLATTDERGWLGLGMAHEALGEQITALRLYETAAHASAAPRCHIARARILRALGRDDDAEAALDSAAMVDDDEVATIIAWERRAA